MATTVLNGMDLTVKVGTTEIAPVTKWNLTITGKHGAYIANNTAGWTKRCAGPRDANGSFLVLVDSVSTCPFDVGDEITLLLYADDATHYLEVPAIVDSLGADVDSGSGEPIAVPVNFSANGAVVRHGWFKGSGV